MTITLLHVDAFADRPFAGNPAAVCLLPGPAPAAGTAGDAWMQALAAELNLPATAFVWPVPPSGAAGGAFTLRWFSPAAELDLCGHGTLAAAHALWDAGRLAPDARARFVTRAGSLSATRREGWIALDFPAQPAAPVDPPEGLLSALGLLPAEVVDVARNRLDYLVALRSESVVRSLAPDLKRLGAVETRGVIVTALSAAPPADFVSRFFAPRTGIDEDPVTGSAHCCLGPYWGARLGRDALLGQQLSARGGAVRVTLAGDRVTLGGQAATVLRGDLVAGPDT